MKTRIALATVFTLLLASFSFAQATPNCVTGTLASYIALGSGGCMFDSALYRDFTYTAATTNGVTPKDITVTPLLLPVAGLYPGLNFSANWTVAAGQSEQSVIGYNVVPFPPEASPVPTGAVLTLDLGPSQVLGIIGSVTVKETVASATATSTSIPLEVYDICADACSIKQTDSVTITPIAPLQTTIVVSLSGGTGGAFLKSFAADDAFGPQPE
ncbi:MAG: hypothetical protein ABSB60_04255 [Terracidiphilus sp.]|jgi:hypothetical protein